MTCRNTTHWRDGLLSEVHLLLDCLQVHTGVCVSTVQNTINLSYDSTNSIWSATKTRSPEAQKLNRAVAEYICMDNFTSQTTWKYSCHCCCFVFTFFFLHYLRQPKNIAVFFLPYTYTLQFCYCIFLYLSLVFINTSSRLFVFVIFVPVVSKMVLSIFLGIGVVCEILVSLQPPALQQSDLWLARSACSSASSRRLSSRALSLSLWSLSSSSWWWRRNTGGSVYLLTENSCTATQQQFQSV